MTCPAAARAERSIAKNLLLVAGKGHAVGVSPGPSVTTLTKYLAIRSGSTMRLTITKPVQLPGLLSTCS